jgi:hypothetical protein
MDSKPLKNVALSHASHSEVVFEDYLFYATLQRKEEEGSQKVNSDKAIDDPQGLPSLSLEEQERMEATRALRIASWISIFFLLTTDMAGPVTAPYAISQVGWVPGVILSVICCVCPLSRRFAAYLSPPPVGILSSYSGVLLWGLFIRLDSLRYPLKTYADVADRILGGSARHICNLLQATQLLISVYSSAAPMRDTMVYLIFPRRLAPLA